MKLRGPFVRREAVLSPGARRGRTASGWRALRRSLTWWTSDLSGRGARPFWVRLKAFNELLSFVLVAGIAALLFFLSRPLALPSSSPAPGKAGVISETDEDVRREEPGLAPFNPRRLFAQPKIASRSAENRANVTLSELAKKLVLRGILWGESPKVILENRGTEQVLHLSEGEFVGEIRIAEIRRNSIVVAWKDQTLELTL